MWRRSLEESNKSYGAETRLAQSGVNDMDGHIFSAGTYLPDQGKISDYEQWTPFVEWFEYYMGHTPDADTSEDVELFEAFYAGRIYQTELIYRKPTRETERKIA